MYKSNLMLGKYKVDKYISYVQKNSEIMDKLLTLYNNFDLEGIQAFFNEFDLDQPYKPSRLSHKRYLENKELIDYITNDSNSYYPMVFSNKNYLDDLNILNTYKKSAQEYDNIWSGVWGYETRKEVVDLMNAKSCEKILEVGVGTGNNLKLFPKDCEITGIDYCKEMLDVCRKKIKNSPSKVTIHEMDAIHMGFPDDYFDKTLCFYALCSTNDPQAVLEEIYRVMKPGGVFIIYDVVKSEIDEVALLQLLYRPIAKVLGPIYLEFAPPYSVIYESYLDIFSLIKLTKFTIEKSMYIDPLKTVAILSLRK